MAWGRLFSLCLSSTKQRRLVRFVPRGLQERLSRLLTCRSFLIPNSYRAISIMSRHYRGFLPQVFRAPGVRTGTGVQTAAAPTAETTAD